MQGWGRSAWPRREKNDRNTAVAPARSKALGLVLVSSEVSFRDAPLPPLSFGTSGQPTVTFPKPMSAILEEFGIKQLKSEFRVNHRLQIPFTDSRTESLCWEGQREGLYINQPLLSYFLIVVK